MIGKRLAAAFGVLFAAVLVCATAIGVIPPAVGHADPIETICPDVIAQLKAWKQKADNHNNRAGSVNTYSKSAVDSYNAEKAQLESERTALLPRVEACESAARAITSKDPLAPPLAKPNPAQRDAIAAALTKIPPGYQPQPVRRGNREVIPDKAPERPLYEELRKGNPGSMPPDSRLAGKAAPKVNSSDPAFPARKIRAGRTGKSKVTPDHIVPLAELIKMRGFLKLTPEQIFAISRLPMNFQWLSWAANMGKNSGSAARLLPGADANWVGRQVQMQDETRSKLQEIIDDLVKANEG